MSKSIGRLLKIRDIACANVKTLYRDAKAQGMLSAAINDEMSRIYDKMGPVPTWVSACVEGYRRALTDVAYERDLVFGGFYNGEWFSTHSDRLDYYGKTVMPSTYATESTLQGHYWMDEKGKCNGSRPFFIMETDKEREAKATAKPAKTRVVFVDCDGDITAIFIDDVSARLNNSGKPLVGCYAHVGQHSECAIIWAKRYPIALPEQYESLVIELSGKPYEYNLDILNAFPKGI